MKAHRRNCCVRLRQSPGSKRAELTALPGLLYLWTVRFLFVLHGNRDNQLSSSNQQITMLGKKILLIDDDADFLKLTSLIFKESGAQAFTARDGLDGMSKLFTLRPDLIILDIMMPDVDGFQICERIRQFSNTPLIMLSALGQDQLMLQGLEAGADDFLSKPINPEILLARAKAVMRRWELNNGYPDILIYDDGRLEIDIEKHRVHLDGKQVKLTPVEFRLLAYLVGNEGRLLSFEQILEKVWGSEFKGNDEYVHVYVSHLRSKIERDPKRPRYILSIHGVGYIFEGQVHNGHPKSPIDSSIGERRW
jgi:DNA-binding response OmpR family regulator